MYAFIIFVWNLKIYNLVSYNDDFRVRVFANTCIEKFDVQIKIVFHFILILQIINYIQRAAPLRSGDWQQFPMTIYFRNTHTIIHSPLPRVWREKVACILLQRRNCTHSTSNSCLGWASMKQINPSMLIYWLAKTCIPSPSTNMLDMCITCWIWQNCIKQNIAEWFQGLSNSNM